MEMTPYIPIIVEATKFLFSELGKRLDHARQRAEEAPKTPTAELSKPSEVTPKLTLREFSALENNLGNLMSAINANLAETNAYAIHGLVQQLQIHIRNLIDLETTEAQYGALTPQHVKRGIEHEAKAIVEKTGRLRDLLSLVYGKRIEIS